MYNRDEQYTPSGFTRKDFKKLGRLCKAACRNTANHNDLVAYAFSSTLYAAGYRDKRIQRTIAMDMRDVLLAPFEDMPIHVAAEDPGVRLIVQWRLDLGR